MSTMGMKDGIFHKASVLKGREAKEAARIRNAARPRVHTWTGLGGRLEIRSSSSDMREKTKRI
jgi:hypothetical protein